MSTSPAEATPDGSFWYPFTQMQELKRSDLIYVQRGEGHYLIDETGKRYFDAISSMWVNLFGHSRTEIADAIARQLEVLPHTSTFGQTHAPVLELARKLTEVTPDGLNHVFFSDDGSTAVESALKMAFQYWQQSDDARPGRTKFVALEHAYHGDTLGAVSVGDIEHFHKLYRPLLFDVLRTPSPYSYRCSLGRTPQDCSLACADALDELLTRRAPEVAALIIEPCVQAAAGMIVHPTGFLRRVRDICDRHDVFLIADEVAVGFGRTGYMFACESESVTPDIMCLGKGLTGGYLPTAATVVTDRVYRGFLAPYEQQKALFHGHSYTGNPLAAAAALASLDIFERDDIMNRMQAPIVHLTERLAALRELEHVGDVRQCGFIVGIELVRDRSTREPFDRARRTGMRVAEAAREMGIILRPLGDVIYYFLPLTTTEEEIDRLVDVTVRAIRSATESE